MISSYGFISHLLSRNAVVALKRTPHAQSYLIAHASRNAVVALKQFSSFFPFGFWAEAGTPWWH